jgi:4-amino-4-deoxy-L-arabinose transferase-like glycosyltransferase
LQIKKKAFDLSMQSFRRVLLVLIAAFWTALILILYFTTYPLCLGYYFEGFFRQFARPYAALPVWYLRDFAFLAVILCASVSAGRFVLRLLRIEVFERVEQLIVALIIGLEGLGLLTFLFGIVGLLYKVFFYVWLLLLCAAGLPSLIATIRAGRAAKVKSRRSRFEIFLIAVLAVLFLIGFLYALAPPTESDGLRYHLAAPQEYVKQHRIHYIPLNAFTNFPFLIEMLFLLGMLVSSDVLAKLLHFTCLMLTCCLLALLWRRFLRPRQNPSDSADGNGRDNPQLLSILVFASTPAVLIVSCWSFIDAGIVLFFIAMVYSLLLWAETREKRALWLLGIMAGGALGTKYTMVAFVALSLAVVFCASLFSRNANNDRRAGAPLRNVVIPAIIAIALASPWYIKNSINTGNPVYPLAYGLFDGGEWSQANAAFYRAKAAEKGLPRTLGHFLTVPFDSALSWQRFEAFNIGVPYLLFTPFLCAFPLWLWRKKMLRHSVTILFVFALAYFVLWYFTYQSNRFLIPLFAILSLLIVYFLESVKRESPAAWAVLLIGLTVATLHNGLWSVRWMLVDAYPQPMPVVLGFEKRDSYLTRALDYYPCFDYLNSHVRSDEKVLLVGEHRGYYCHANYLASDWFDTPYLLHIIRQTRDNNDLLQWLRAHSVDYVFFNFREMRLYWQAYFKPRFTPGEYERFLDFVRSKRLQKVFSLAADMYICKIQY